jgi:hypothetical protein
LISYMNPCLGGEEPCNKKQGSFFVGNGESRSPNRQYCVI